MRSVDNVVGHLCLQNQDEQYCDTIKYEDEREFCEKIVGLYVINKLGEECKKFFKTEIACQNYNKKGESSKRMKKHANVESTANEGSDSDSDSDSHSDSDEDKEVGKFSDSHGESEVDRGILDGTSEGTAERRAQCIYYF